MNLETPTLPNRYLWELYNKYGGDFLDSDIIIFKDGTSVEYLGHDTGLHPARAMFRINYGNPEWPVRRAAGRLPLLYMLPYEVKGDYARWSLH